MPAIYLNRGNQHLKFTVNWVNVLKFGALLLAKAGGDISVSPGLINLITGIVGIKPTIERKALAILFAPAIGLSLIHI